MTWRLPKVGKLPKIIHFHRIFRSKPSTKWGWTIPSIWPSAISGKKVPWSTCHGFYSLKTTHMTISWSYWGWFLIQLLNLVIVIHCHYDWVYQITIWSICGQFKKNLNPQPPHGLCSFIIFLIFPHAVAVGSGARNRDIIHHFHLQLRTMGEANYHWVESVYFFKIPASSTISWQKQAVQHPLELTLRPSQSHVEQASTGSSFYGWNSFSQPGPALLKHGRTKPPFSDTHLVSFHPINTPLIHHQFPIFRHTHMSYCWLPVDYTFHDIPTISMAISGT